MTEILFYSDLPYAYHNPEAEERMRRFAARGYRIVYVPKLGIRNPRPGHLLAAARRLSARKHGSAKAAPDSLRVVNARLLPPRHRRPLDSLNRHWLARQLLGEIRDPAATVLWIRFPTPELVPLVEATRFKAVVYEMVDAHEAAAGFRARHRALFHAAERRILARTDLVFASSEPIRARLAELHPNVVRIPAAAVDFEALARAGRTARPRARLAVHVGGLNERIDIELLDATARRLSDWRFLLAGPFAPSFERLRSLGNVELPGAVAPGEVASVLAQGAVCLMPYRVNDFNRTLFPVKMIEALAVGRPVISTPIDAALEFQQSVSVASDPPSYAEAIDRAAAEDTHDRAEARRAQALPYDWEARVSEMEAAIEGAVGARA